MTRKLLQTIGVCVVAGLSCASLCEAVDLSQVSRELGQEPEYQAEPYYALLVFGENADRRAWLVVDGDVVYVDRNGNGDLTDAGERVPLDVEETKKVKLGGPGAYTGMNVFDLGEVAGLRLRLQFWVRNPDFVPTDDFYRKIIKERTANRWENATLWRVTADGSRAQNPVVLCPRPECAQVSHLSGPRTFALKWDERQVLKRGEGDCIFDVHIGTPGLATDNCDYGIFSPLTTGEVAADVHPVASFEFPHRTPGEPPILLDVTLDLRC